MSILSLLVGNLRAPADQARRSLTFSSRLRVGRSTHEADLLRP
jgi:hypothetical protein